jgi:hypothetical protein
MRPSAVLKPPKSTVFFFHGHSAGGLRVMANMASIRHKLIIPILHAPKQPLVLVIIVDKLPCLIEQITK